MKKFFARGDLWFGFARIDSNRRGKRVVRPVYGRLLGVLLALAMSGWIVLTLAGFFFVRLQMDFREGNYLDVVFPFRWDNYKASLGDSHVEKAKEALSEQNFRNFELFLRRGVAHSPGNLEGRRLLAELDLWRNDTRRAAAGISRGLEFEHALQDTEFVNFALRVFLAAEEDDEIHALRNLILEGSFPEESVQSVVLISSQAHFLRGNLNEAEELLTAHNLQEDRDGRLLQMRIDWDRGSREEVLDDLNNWLRAEPGNEILLQLKLRFLLDQGNYREAEQTAVLYALRHPHSITPHIFHLTVLGEIEEWEQMNQRFNILGQRFERNPAAFAQLVNLANQYRRTELSQILLDRAEQTERNLPIAILGQWENAMHNRDMTNARRLSLRILEQPEKFEEPALAARKAALLVAWHVLNNADTDATSAANALLPHLFRHPEAVLRISPLLIEEREWSHLNRLLTEALRLHPRQNAVVGQMILAAMARNDFAEVTRRLDQYLGMRGVDGSFLRSIGEFLQSDRFIFIAGREESLEKIRQSGQIQL